MHTHNPICMAFRHELFASDSGLRGGSTGSTYPILARVIKVGRRDPPANDEEAIGLEVATSGVLIPERVAETPR